MECGRIDGCITPNTPSRPESAYAVAKTVASAKLQSSCEALGMKFCWPRLLSTYGPYDRPHTLVMQCIRAALLDEEIALTAGEQIWDYIFVEDVARALCAIAENGKHGYCGGNGEYAHYGGTWQTPIPRGAGNESAGRSFRFDV